MIEHVSIFIIVKNAESTLSTTLDSVTRFTNVLVYDNGSEDATKEIAEQYQNVTLVSGKFFGFGPTKNIAASMCTNDWVFSLDADESLSAELVDSLADWSPSQDIRTVGKVLRKNWMLGKEVTHSGWQRDWLVRLFNRKSYLFNQNMVHESVELGGSTLISTLNGSIKHCAVNDLSQFLVKINRYSSLHAEHTTKNYSPFMIACKSAFAFFRTYILRMGMLDGWRGFVISVAEAEGVFWKYAKTYANHHASKKVDRKT